MSVSLAFLSILPLQDRESELIHSISLHFSFACPEHKVIPHPLSGKIASWFLKDLYLLPKSFDVSTDHANQVGS